MDEMGESTRRAVPGLSATSLPPWMDRVYKKVLIRTYIPGTDTSSFRQPTAVYIVVPVITLLLAICSVCTYCSWKKSLLKKREKKQAKLVRKRRKTSIKPGSAQAMQRGQLFGLHREEKLEFGPRASAIGIFSPMLKLATELESVETLMAEFTSTTAGESLPENRTTYVGLQPFNVTINPLFSTLHSGSCGYVLSGAKDQAMASALIHRGPSILQKRDSRRDSRGDSRRDSRRDSNRTSTISSLSSTSLSSSSDENSPTPAPRSTSRSGSPTEGAKHRRSKSVEFSTSNDSQDKSTANPPSRTSQASAPSSPASRSSDVSGAPSSILSPRSSSRSPSATKPSSSRERGSSSSAQHSSPWDASTHPQSMRRPSSISSPTSTSASEGGSIASSSRSSARKVEGSSSRRSRAPEASAPNSPTEIEAV